MTAAEEDAAYRNAWGTAGRRPFGSGLRAAYYEGSGGTLPEAPRGRYVTHEDARRYLVAIQDTLDRHGWSKHEREHLRRLKVRWARRVAGLDPRFEAMGVQGGVSERFRPPTRMDALHTLRRELMPFKTVSESWPFGSPRVRGLDLLLQ